MSQPATVLIVDDEPDVREVLEEYFTTHGFEVRVAADAAAARALLKSDRADVALIDVHMPGEDGLSLARHLREHHAGLAIVMLTSASTVVDRIVGLEVGADEYITKPFSPREVVARIRSILRRASYGLAAGDRPVPLRFDGWRIDPIRRQVHDPANTRVALTTTEFDLLLAFCSNPGRVITREELLTLPHSGLAGPIERSVDVHIRRLRQKIEADASDPVLLRTVRLGGYLFALSLARGHLR